MSQPCREGLRLDGSEDLLLLCTVDSALKGQDLGAGKPDCPSAAKEITESHVSDLFHLFAWFVLKRTFKGHPVHTPAISSDMFQ